MSVGQGLLQKAIEEARSLSYLEEHGLGAKSFRGDESKIYVFIQKYYLKYGRYPTPKTIQVETEVAWLDFPDEPIGYWLDRTTERARTQLILDTVDSVNESIKDDKIEEAAEQVRSLSLELDRCRVGGTTVSTLGNNVSLVLDHHDTRQHSAGISGVPFGIEYLDNVSDGAQPSDSVALVGRPGVGKTYFLLSMALASSKLGETPLVVTTEMSGLQVSRRLTALNAGVPATSIRLGRLSYWGRQKLVQSFEQFSTTPPFYIMEGTLTSTIEDVIMRVQELRPTVLYVDGAYMLHMADKHTAKWERVSAIAETLKMIAKDFLIPVIATWQFNRKGPSSLANIGLSDSIGQLASIVCSIEDEKIEGRTDNWQAVTYKILKLMKGREGEKGTIRVLYDMSRMLIQQDSVVAGYSLEGNVDAVDEVSTDG